MVNEPEEISEKIRQFTFAQFPAARVQSLSDEDSLITKRIIDSMGILDLVLFIENEFGLSVDEEEFLVENFESVASLTRFVKKKISQR
jgi:acyl carrier protein